MVWVKMVDSGSPSQPSCCSASPANGTLNERLYSICDANYNVIALADTAGDVQERYSYDAYGRMNVLTPDFASRSTSSYNWEYTFTGRRLDAETGLMYYRNRYYNTQLGRFINRDPIGYRGGSNLYCYVGNRPIIATDPEGLWHSGEHERQTNLVFSLFSPIFCGRKLCMAKVLSILKEANVGQDSGSWPGGSSHEPGEKNYRHFCADKGQTRKAAITVYLNYTAGELATFRYELSLSGSSMSTKSKNCRRALEALGRITHSWQDFYAHAIRNVLQVPGVGPPVFPVNLDLVWGDGAPLLDKGNPDRPGPDVKPPMFYWPTLGEHGRKEPAARDGIRGEGRRKSASFVFVTGKYNKYLRLWFNKCRCVCENMGVSLGESPY